MRPSIRPARCVPLHVPLHVHLRTPPLHPPVVAVYSSLVEVVSKQAGPRVPTLAAAQGANARLFPLLQRRRLQSWHGAQTAWATCAAWMIRWRSSCWSEFKRVGTPAFRAAWRNWCDGAALMRSLLYVH